MLLKGIKTLSILLCIIACNAVQASIIWDWSFNGESGTFVSEGDSLAAGNLLVTDFTVSASLMGATLGSWSGGDYTPNEYGNTAPYWINWDGNSVTELISSGGNWNTWFTFNDLNSRVVYLFDYGTGNRNVQGSAMAYIGDVNAPSYQYSINPTLLSAPEIPQVPEPSTLAIFALGIWGVMRSMRKNHSCR